jgi:hypothetical protein
MEYCDFPFVIRKEMGSGKWKRTDNLIFMDPCIVEWFSRNNQKDATLY